MGVALAVVCGPVLSGLLFASGVVTRSHDIPVALIGLIGTVISAVATAGTTYYIYRQVASTERRLDEQDQVLEDVDRKVSSPRRIAARAGDEFGAVVVEPPEDPTPKETP